MVVDLFSGASNSKYTSFKRSLRIHSTGVQLKRFLNWYCSVRTDKPHCASKSGSVMTPRRFVRIKSQTSSNLLRHCCGGKMVRGPKMDGNSSGLNKKPCSDKIILPYLASVIFQVVHGYG